MKRFFKNWMGLSIIVFAFLIIAGLETAPAQQYFSFVGKVTSLSGGFLGVQGGKGEVMYFATGRKTIYVPAHLPAVGERVKVSYFFRRGHNVAYQVEVLPPPPPPPPPAPTTTVTPSPPVEESKEKKSIFGCARGCSPWGSKERSK
jgi:hypothetical protein